MSERRALKLRCGAICYLRRCGSRGIPKLSLIWRKRLQPLQNIRVQQGSLIRHGWTISFNPKIVVMQNHHHSPTGAARNEQVFALQERARAFGQSDQVTTKLLRDTVLVDRLVASKAENGPGIDRAFRSRPAMRSPEFAAMQYLRNARSRLTPTVQQRFEPPPADFAQAYGQAQRATSPWAAILPQRHAARAEATSPIVWQRPSPIRSGYMPSSEPKLPSKTSPVFLPTRPTRRGLAGGAMQRSSARPTAAIMQPNSAKRAVNAHAALHLQRRQPIEQIWLKSPESSNGLIEIAPGRQFAHPAASHRPDPQPVITPQPSPPASSQPQLPDMSRLVDEVMRRIDRVSRDERLRRGV